MGWTLRKTIKLGPLNINLSRSGIGASVGVRGARIGVNGKGKGYVAGGRGPVRYHKQVDFGGKPKAEAIQNPASPQPRPGVDRFAAWLIVALLGAFVLLLIFIVSTVAFA